MHGPLCASGGGCRPLRFESRPSRFESPPSRFESRPPRLERQPADPEHRLSGAESWPGRWVRPQRGPLVMPQRGARGLSCAPSRLLHAPRRFSWVPVHGRRSRPRHTATRQRQKLFALRYPSQMWRERHRILPRKRHSASLHERNTTLGQQEAPSGSIGSRRSLRRSETGETQRVELRSGSRSSSVARLLGGVTPGIRI